MDLLINIGLPKLVSPFQTNHVNGSVLSNVESPQDLIDLDTIEVKPIFAKTLFNKLVAWKKDDGWRIPVKLLVPQQSSHLKVAAMETPSKVFYRV